MTTTMFHDIYRGRRVLVTGDTGFKGSWLCFWLKHLGAELCGVGLPMETTPSHSALLPHDFRSETCDIRDTQRLQTILSDFQPEILFHLAAQPLVRLSYADPLETFSVNVQGTASLLEACRRTASLRAVVAITSDKCYENDETPRGRKESDPMGGYDPYSASKGCAELLISAYRRSFFNNDDFGKKHHTLVASARAGNVIGGGDWAPDRLVPDLMKAAAQGIVSEIRSPEAIRPWQHVLEPLSGYLLLGERLWQGDRTCADGWNFGPPESHPVTVAQAAEALARIWPAVRFRLNPPADQPHEARYLQLDCTKAHDKLAWHGVLFPAECFELTARWYRDHHERQQIDTAAQLEQYCTLAAERGLIWTK